MCEHACTSRSMPWLTLEVRGQVCKVSSLLSPWVSNPGHEPCMYVWCTTPWAILLALFKLFLYQECQALSIWLQINTYFPEILCDFSYAAHDALLTLVNETLFIENNLSLCACVYVCTCVQAKRGCQLPGTGGISSQSWDPCRGYQEANSSCTRGVDALNCWPMFPPQISVLGFFLILQAEKISYYWNSDFLLYVGWIFWLKLSAFLVFES